MQCAHTKENRNSMLQRSSLKLRGQRITLRDNDYGPRKKENSARAPSREEQRAVTPGATLRPNLVVGCVLRRCHRRGARIWLLGVFCAGVIIFSRHHSLLGCAIRRRIWSPFICAPMIPLATIGFLALWPSASVYDENNTSLLRGFGFGRKRWS